MLGQLPRSPGASSSVANTSLCSLYEDVFIPSLLHILLAKCAVSSPLGTCISNSKRGSIWEKPPGIPELSLTREIPMKPRPKNVQTPGKAVGCPRPHGHRSRSGVCRCTGRVGCPVDAGWEQGDCSAISEKADLPFFFPTFQFFPMRQCVGTATLIPRMPTMLIPIYYAASTC